MPDPHSWKIVVDEDERDPGLHLEAIFQNPKVRQVFFRWAKIEFGLENCILRVAIAQYRYAPSFKRAQAIHDLFLSTSAPYELNTTRKHVENVVDGIKQAKNDSLRPPAELFDEIEGDVDLALADVLSRFRLSPAARKLGFTLKKKTPSLSQRLQKLVKKKPKTTVKETYASFEETWQPFFCFAPDSSSELWDLRIKLWEAGFETGPMLLSR